MRSPRQICNHFCCLEVRSSGILPANRRFWTALALAPLQAQKLALWAQTVCAAAVPLREERLPKTRRTSLYRIRPSAFTYRPIRQCSSCLSGSFPEAGQKGADARRPTSRGARRTCPYVERQGTRATQQMYLLGAFARFAGRPGKDKNLSWLRPLRDAPPVTRLLTPVAG